MGIAWCRPLVLGEATPLGPPTGPGAETSAAPVRGDIAIVGFYSDGATASIDSFSFVILADIGGQTINFTDNGWLSTGAFRTGEGVLYCTVPVGTAIGTVVTLPASPMDLSVTGDQIIAFTGTLASPTTILFAVDFANAAGWNASATSANTSACAGRADRWGQCALLPTDNAAYTGSLSGTREQILANIGTIGMWTTDDNAAVPFPTGFTGQQPWGPRHK